MLELPQAPTFTMIRAFCMRLIYKGAPKSAYTVLVELMKPDRLPSVIECDGYGSFLIKELIYANTVNYFICIITVEINYQN